MKGAGQLSHGAKNGKHEGQRQTAFATAMTSRDPLQSSCQLPVTINVNTDSAWGMWRSLWQDGTIEISTFYSNERHKAKETNTNQTNCQI